MPARAAAAICSVLVAAAASPQAVSEWTSASGVPIAIVETPGGDVEHLVVVLPPDAVPPERIMGVTVALGSVPGARLLTLSSPALLAVVAIREALAEVVAHPLGAVVLLGPVPGRELRGALTALDTASWRPLPRSDCAVADGAVEVVRGAGERVELTFAGFAADDPRVDLLPVLAAWLRVRLGSPFAGARVDMARVGGCTRLLVSVPAGDEAPRELLARLRAAVRAAGRSDVTAEEVALANARVARGGARWAADGSGVARELAVRRALPASVAGALHPPIADAEAVAELAGVVLGRHIGAARLVEEERRALAASSRTLDSGVTVTWRWIPGEVAVVSFAFGGVTPAVGRAASEAFAAAAAGHGWMVEIGDLLGVHVVTVATPPQDVVDVLEVGAATAAAAPATTVGTLEDEAALAAGLGERVAGDAIAVAMALPESAEDAPEAVLKFFSTLPGGAVRSSAPRAAPLAWTPAAPPARLAALVEVAPDAIGMLAGELLAARLATTAGARARWLAAPGRVLLLLTSEGASDVPALDGALAAAWRKARGKVVSGELQAAARRLATALYGDLLRANGRAAAATFLPAMPAAEELLAAEETAAGAALAALPAWEALPRLAYGPAPPEPAPDVRESRPPAPAGP